MNKELRMRNTSAYNYLNLNPKNKYCGDCVIRAIALATNQTWEQTIRELTELGIKKGYVLNDKRVYPEYLKLKGFKEMNEPRDDYNTKYTINQFLQCHYEANDDIIVANVGSHHVTCIKYGIVYDTWNCSNNILHKYWVKQ